RGTIMKEDDVRKRAFAMLLTSPAYPQGPYRFLQREYLIITYRTDPDKLHELVPEPLEVDQPVVRYEFIRMPDSTGFGDYTETGQVIPVSFWRPQGRLHALHVSSTTVRRSPAGASCGASPRNWHSQACAPRSTHWSAHSTMARRALRPAPWVINTRRPTSRR